MERPGALTAIAVEAHVRPDVARQAWPGPSSILDAYAASTRVMASSAAALDHGDLKARLGPTAIQVLVHDVLEPLEPLARSAGLRLLRDLDSRYEAVCCADPLQLRQVLSHLVLRALATEGAPGHVRIMVTLSSHEARILILSRAPDAAPAAPLHPAHNDLAAPRRVLQAMGGALVLEPRRAGYLPTCVALRALCAAPALRAA